MKETIFLTNELKNLFSSGDFFSIAENIEGEIFRKTANRITKEFTFEGDRYFIKLHYGVGWKEIFKNICKFRAPTIGASPELKALKKLRSLGIECPEPVAFFSRGVNPAKKYSFIITKALIQTISLEDLLLKERTVLSLKKKRQLLKNLALISRKLHLSGVNHRDYYLCHFHVRKDLDFSIQNIFLIDLHRAQIRRKVPLRWITKDIGSLLHSAMDLFPTGYTLNDTMLTEMDCYRFLEIYFDKSLREVLKENRGFIRASRKRAFSMYMDPILKAANIEDKKGNPDSVGYYKRGKNEGRRWIAKGETDFGSLEPILSNPDEFMSKGEEVKFEAGNHVVALDLPNHSIFIKKFQVKGPIHYLRKFFSPTRAITAWKAQLWLNAAGINTVNLRAVIETHDSFTTRESYLIIEKEYGERLDQIEITETLEKLIPNKMAALIKRLGWIGFNHGDAKGSNFFFDKNRLIVSDLDACKRRYFQVILANKLAKDKKRILRSFESYPKVKESLLRRF